MKLSSTSSGKLQSYLNILLTSLERHRHPLPQSMHSLGSCTLLNIFRTGKGSHAEALTCVCFNKYVNGQNSELRKHDFL